MILKNATTGSVLAKRVQRVRSPWRRIIGWLHRSSISNEEGLFFERCDAIHTIGMRTPIDVVFLDQKSRVRGISPWLQPGRVHVGPDRAHSVLEMAPGFIERHDVLVGDWLILDHEEAS